MICSMGQGVDAAAMPWSGVSVAIEWAGDDDGATVYDDSSSACDLWLGP
jgi:hypothetical protein